jgi:Derlin-2/3
MFHTGHPITVLLTGTSGVLLLLLYLQIVSEYDLYFNSELILRNHQYWRLFTSVIYVGSLSVTALIQLYLVYQHGSAVETAFFASRPVDYIVFLLFGMAFLWVSASFFPLIWLGIGVSSYLTYYDSKRAPERLIALVIFPHPFAAQFFPIVLVVLSLINGMGQSLYVTLLGFLAAHLYFFLQDVLSLRFDINVFLAPTPVNRFFARFLA